MKTLKFSDDLVLPIQQGDKTTTWRYADDKNITVGDELQLINSKTGEAFGYAVVNETAEKRIKDLSEHDMQGHKIYKNQAEMLAEFQKYYGPHITPDSIVKVVKYTFSPQPQERVVEKYTTQLTEVKLYTDGGSRGNPGPSASGYVLVDMEGNVVKSDGKYLGLTTNNQAEYQAVLLGLETAKKLGAKTVHVYMDSLLVVNQMSGIFKIKNRELWPIHQAIRSLTAEFESVKYTHIPREMNKQADAQVNRILDEHQQSGMPSELL